MPPPPRALHAAELIADGTTPAWVADAYAQYRDVILDPAFPCYFGTKAQERERMRFSYVCGGERDHLPDVLRSFVEHSRAYPKHRSVLLVFYEPDGRQRTLAEDEDRFWELLGWLHERDREPWPADVPTDPSDPHWEYCFAGDPMFVFPCSPAYRARRSRRMGPYYMVCFQPRRVFYGVESGSPAGQRARERIWQRVRAWDPIEPHPKLEHMAYGDPEMREWKQYVLPDENTPLRASCPFAPKAGAASR
jgi:FPC/CPF motif-containing protein YcgG